MAQEKRETTMRTISSQRYLDPVIVAAKRNAGDYSAQRVTVEIDGERLYVVVDGHHSIAAARADGVDVEWETNAATQAEADYATREGIVSDWMAQRQLDAEWYDIATGRDAW